MLLSILNFSHKIKVFKLTTTLQPQVIYINQETNQDVFFLALELSNSKWKLGFSDGNRNRIKNVDAGDIKAVLEEIELARNKFGLSAHAELYSCYEAGRDGFWIHRWLIHNKINNHVIDSASIEVSRKSKKAKTDKIDVIKMVEQLVRYIRGDKKALTTVVVPSEEAEDNRQLHRERERLKKERTGISNHISSALVTEGIRGVKLNKEFVENIKQMTRWDGSLLGEDLQAKLIRAYERYECVNEQIRLLEKQQQERTAQALDGSLEKVKRMMMLKGVGWQSSWILTMELFAWRTFKNRRHLASFIGLTGTPFASGDINNEQGISKAGNKRVRGLMVELAWLWLRYQPQSDLAQWFERRFAQGGRRMRRIGIVAVARKLLIALWRYVEEGIVPQGAIFKVAS